MGTTNFFPNEIIPNVKILNPKNGKNPKRKNPEKGKVTKLCEGEGTKLGEGKGTKLGEHCSKVRLSQDRMTIESLTQQQPARDSGFLHKLMVRFGIFTFGIFTFGIISFGKSLWRHSVSFLLHRKAKTI